MKGLFVITIVFLLFTPVYALDIEGKVIDNFGNVILLTTAPGKEEVILADKNTLLKNLLDINDINERDYLRIKYNREVAGVKIAETIEVDRGVELFDPSIDISSTDIFNLIQSRGEYFIIDMRPVEKYEYGHIKNAMSLPRGSGIERLSIPKDQLIIFYGEDKRDHVPVDAAKKALASGYTNVKVYLYGIEKWIVDRYFIMTTVNFFKKGMHEKRPLVFVDTRPDEIFITGHIPGAINVRPEDLKRAELDRENGKIPIVLYGEDANDTLPEKIALIATLAGYTEKSGEPVRILEGGFKAWQTEGMPVEKGKASYSVDILSRTLTDTIHYEEFKGLWGKKSDKVMLLDVRTNEEASRPILEFTKNIPLAELPFRISEIPKHREIIIFCSSGIRSMIAYYILKKNGYKVRYLKRELKINSDGTLME